MALKWDVLSPFLIIFTIVVTTQSWDFYEKFTHVIVYTHLLHPHPQNLGKIITGPISTFWDEEFKPW